MIFEGLESDVVQDLVLQAGSKEGFKEYWRLSDKALQEVWSRFDLLTPVQYLRSLNNEAVFEELARQGSIDNLSSYLGVSLSTLKENLRGRVPEGGRDLTKELVKQLKTVRLLARVTRKSERAVRKWIEEQALGHLLDTSQMGNTTGNGRRAEVFFASQEGSNILDDMNKLYGPKAEYDFLHNSWGRVNVKSSRPYTYTAKTRRDNPTFYKIGTGGLDKCDNAAVVVMNSNDEPIDFLVVDSESLLQFNTGTVSLQVDFTTGTWVFGSKGARFLEVDRSTGVKINGYKARSR